MKTFQLAVMATLVLMACHRNQQTDNSEIPQSVKAKFASEHTEVMDIRWGMEDGNFEAEYYEDGMERSVVYNAEGKVLIREKQIEISSLPSVIMDYIVANYPDSDIEKAEFEATEDGDFYELEVETNDTEVELIFDANGNFVEQEQDADDEDDPNDIDEQDDADDEQEVEINVTELPQAVKDGIAAEYPGAEMLEADEITREDGSHTYDVEIRYEGKVIEVMFDSEGAFLGVEEE